MLINLIVKSMQVIREDSPIYFRCDRKKEIIMREIAQFARYRLPL